MRPKVSRAINFNEVASNLTFIKIPKGNVMELFYVHSNANNMNNVIEFANNNIIGAKEITNYDDLLMFFGKNDIEIYNYNRTHI